MQFPWLKTLLLISHKTTFCENEAAYLCVTMWKRSSHIVATIWHLKFWHRYHGVGNKIFWCQLEASLSRKRGSPHVKFLHELLSWLHALHNGVNETWGSNVSENDISIKCSRNIKCTNYWEVSVIVKAISTLLGSQEVTSMASCA